MTGTRSGRIYRTGWLATTLALAIALVVGSFTNYRFAREAGDAATRGQADLLAAAVREAVMQGTSALNDARLNELLAAHEEDGLRYIALLDTAGVVTYSAGEPVEARTGPQTRPGFGGPGEPMEQVAGRVVVRMPRPPTFAELASRDSAQRSAGSPQQGGEGRRGGPGGRRWIVLEMEPVLASGLVSRASRSLVLASVGAGILTLAAFLFWRISEQYAAARIHLEEQRRLTVLGEMSAVLAHEIRNPLASLKGNAQLLAERMPEDSRDRARADRVVAEALRLEALTSDLLDFARTGPIEMANVDPAEVLRTSVDDVADGGFELDAAESPRAWRLDARRIRQALVNVLQNARQVSGNGRVPIARVAEEHGRLVFEVRDFGPGLPADGETRIFDPFFTTRTNGTGLGLAVAKRIAEMHRGHITARNHPAGGAVFRIELPQ